MKIEAQECQEGIKPNATLSLQERTQTITSPWSTYTVFFQETFSVLEKLSTQRKIILIIVFEFSLVHIS